jgi:hypothetical protein
VIILFNYSIDKTISVHYIYIMAQTQIGAYKIAAKMIGVTLKEYQAKLFSGEKWCSGCKQWHKISAFGKDANRSDKLSTVCFSYRKTMYDRKYIHKVRISKKGSRFVLPRDNDKRQARARINHLVDIGILSDPNDLNCSDCGHVYDKKIRHEYHHESYTADKQEIVIILCTKCHVKRHMENGTWGKR